jgi:uncharacterized membrane protein YeaQ/YmgE (transglycosylase-associated protein family)
MLVLVVSGRVEMKFTEGCLLSWVLVLVVHLMVVARVSPVGRVLGSTRLGALRVGEGQGDRQRVTVIHLHEGVAILVAAQGLGIRKRHAHRLSVGLAGVLLGLVGRVLVSTLLGALKVSGGHGGLQGIEVIHLQTGAAILVAAQGLGRRKRRAHRLGVGLAGVLLGLVGRVLGSTLLGALKVSDGHGDRQGVAVIHWQTGAAILVAAQVLVGRVGVVEVGNRSRIQHDEVLGLYAEFENYLDSGWRWN